MFRHNTEEKRPIEGSANPKEVAYSLGIYLLNLFLAFISPKFDPSLEQDQDMEDGVPAGEASSLPTKNDQEFKPFVRRLPEFKFWHAATRAIALAFMCCWSEIFNLPVFWPVLVLYWLILVFLTMRRQIQAMIKYRCDTQGLQRKCVRFGANRVTGMCRGTGARRSTPRNKWGF